MVIIAVIGVIPVFMGPAILSATTVSGAMVMGLAPIFIFWNRPAPRLSFWLPVLAGVALVESVNRPLVRGSKRARAQPIAARHVGANAHRGT